MNLIKQNHPRSIASLFDKILNETFHNDFFVTTFPQTIDDESKAPRSNVFENETEVNIEMSIPGVKKQDINISIEDGILNVVGKNNITKELNKANVIRKEFNYSEFYRSFTLPDNINVENISSKYEDGILFINLPKFEKEEHKTNKKLIEIK
jgi:HSP20 family protein